MARAENCVWRNSVFAYLKKYLTVCLVVCPYLKECLLLMMVLIQNKNVCVRACVHVCMYACVHACMCVCVCVCVCVCLCVYEFRTQAFQYFLLVHLQINFFCYRRFRIYEQSILRILFRQCSFYIESFSEICQQKF